MSGAFRVGGDAYDDFMGRYARSLAPLFADFAGVRSGMHVLDVGAGTGALTAELVARGASAAAVDPSPEFVSVLRERFPDLEVHEASAESLPFEDGAFDAALAQLVVAFMSDAPAAVAEMAHRTAQELRDLLAPHGEVESAELDVSAAYRDFDEFWQAMDRGVGPAGQWMASLDAEARERTRDELSRQLGSPQGPFELDARAFAVAVTPG